MFRYQRELSVALAYLLLLGLLWFCAPKFYQGDNFWSVLVSSTPVLVAGLGMTLIILTRQIDISVGSQFAVCGVIAGLTARAGLPLPLVWLSALGSGVVLGAINGALVAGLKLPSIVVTLATMVTYRETLRWALQGKLIGGLPQHFQWFGLSQLSGQMVIVGTAGILLFAFGWALSNLAAGRMVYATGSDAEAARLAGIQPQRVTFQVFVLMGLLSAAAALLSVVVLPSVDPNAGRGLEMQVIAAVVVGGTAVTGGRGSVCGTVIGALLLSTIGPAMTFMGVAGHWEKAMQGAIILIAVASDAFQGRGRSRP
ncbi:MAG: permease component of ribose/xylose/arabinose/galactoside ABC-type transporter [Planctomycetaceae bacterium]|nr:permease component of ribose/xylose/arabinose/galactoside ABC-type transporter [Planctomycetaceae bacterium]